MSSANKNIEKKLKAASELIHEALRELGASPTNPIARTASSSSAAISLPEHILALRDDGFLRTPRTVQEIHVELKDGYPCEYDRVRVALIRLLKKKEVRKTSKEVEGEKVIAYVW